MTDFTGLRKHFRVMSKIGLDYCDSGNRGAYLPSKQVRDTYR